MRGKVAVLFSGGKDSTLAAFYTFSMGFDVVLVTFSPIQEDSYMLHKPCLSLTPLQAKAMGMEHRSFNVSGEKEREVDEMLKHLRGLNIDGISTGAVESEYQKQRIDYIGEELGIPTYSFLWHRNREVMEDFREMEIILIKASGYGISASDVGKPFKGYYHPYIHPFLEGGEGETAVLDAPFFKKRISIVESEVGKTKDTAELVVKKAILAEKGVSHGKKGV
jgi:predicted ATP pyrophosphatase (TIGR00289 family)